MSALPTRFLASLASSVPLTDAQLDKLENSNQRRIREAEERVRWETEMALGDPEMMAIVRGEQS